MQSNGHAGRSAVRRRAGAGRGLCVIGGGEVIRAGLCRMRNACTTLTRSMRRSNVLPSYDAGRWRELWRRPHPADARNEFAFNSSITACAADACAQRFLRVWRHRGTSRPGTCTTRNSLAVEAQRSQLCRPRPRRCRWRTPWPIIRPSALQWPQTTRSSRSVRPGTSVPRVQPGLLHAGRPFSSKSMRPRECGSACA